MYAYRGEENTPAKEWLAACLWYNLSGGGNPSGKVIQQMLIDQALSLGFSTREWMDSVLMTFFPDYEVDQRFFLYHQPDYGDRY